MRTNILKFRTNTILDNSHLLLSHLSNLWRSNNASSVFEQSTLQRERMGLSLRASMVLDSPSYPTSYCTSLDNLRSPIGHSSYGASLLVRLANWISLHDVLHARLRSTLQHANPMANTTRTSQLETPMDTSNSKTTRRRSHIRMALHLLMVTTTAIRICILYTPRGLMAHYTIQRQIHNQRRTV